MACRRSPTRSRSTSPARWASSPREQGEELPRSGVHRYNHNLETARSLLPRGRHDAHLGGAVGDARARARAWAWRCAAAGSSGWARRSQQRAEFAAAAGRARARRGPAELPRPAPGHAVCGPRAQSARRTRCGRSPRSAWRCPRTVLRFAGGRELTLGDLGTRQGVLGGINAMIVGNYLTTLGRSARRRPRPARRARDAGQGTLRDGMNEGPYCDGCGRSLADSTTPGARHAGRPRIRRDSARSAGASSWFRSSPWDGRRAVSAAGR